MRIMANIQFFSLFVAQYDSTGRQKSTGFVTTAEGEDQTLNGQTTGYKAATTTVEDDGKRSTYSIHS